MPNILRATFLGCLVALMAGCESTRWNWLKRDPNTQLAGKPGAAPNVRAVVDYLNENAKRMRTLQVNDLDVDASMGAQSFNLRGRIYAEKPKNFRMKVTLFGKEEVDIGSNSREFWFWALKNPEKHQYFCSYQDLQAGRVKAMPLPLQPEWVMEALGLGPYGPADKYKLETDGQFLKLIETSKSPQGKAVRKVIVMHRREMKAPQPQVTAFLLLDDLSGQEICSAHITSTTVDRVKGVILPHRMELRVPAQQMTMKLHLDGVTVDGQILGTAFARPQMSGVQPFNLATGQVEPWGAQRTGGFR